MANDNNNSSLKAFGVVLTIVALITGMAAIIRPLQQQITGIDRKISNVRLELVTHTLEDNHPWGVISKVAALQEKFTEVETQFKALREREDLVQVRDYARFDKLEDWQTWWYRNVPVMDAQQSSRLDNLEREIYQRQFDKTKNYEYLNEVE